MRHWAIHASAWRHTGNIDMEILVEKAKRHEHYLEWERKTITLQSLLDIWKQSGDPSLEFVRFIRPVIQQFNSEHFGDPNGGGEVGLPGTLPSP